MNKPIFEKGFDPLESKPREHHDFRPDINGLRALAVLSVLAFHAGLHAPGGFAGVDIFFVISGFLISRIILSERTAGNFSLAGFYGKRVKRILPALLLTLFSAWIAGWFLFNIIEFRLLGGHMEGSSYFSVNLWLYRQASGPAAYFDLKSRLLPLLHLWSLSIEEQFYVVWPALILLLFRVRRLLTPAIALIFVASLAYCIVMTDVNSTAAFYLLSSRAWELALGALLAEREVFWKPSAPSPLVANLGAGAGIVLMLLTIFWLVDSASVWPGYLALAPTLGCALVIASPGAKISRILLGNRVAQFFGLISYPLYLWHWPLLSFAHREVGKDLPGALTAVLLAGSVLLAWLTFRFVERPIAAAYARRPLRVAILLLVGLALAGALGVATRMSDGFAQRFPESIVAVYHFSVRDGEHAWKESACVDKAVDTHDSLGKARQKARALFNDSACSKPPRADLPTIVVLGDSHGLQLVSGLKKVYRDRANVLLLSALGCRPLLAKEERIHSSPRCVADNEEIVRDIIALKPAAIVVGGYFSSFFSDHDQLRAFMQDFNVNVATLRQAGVTAPVFVMGQVPTWSPDLLDLVVAELSAGKEPTRITRDNLQPESIETDSVMAAFPWGENVHYMSQVAKLCDERGCSRFVGPRVPEDMVALDYGHYTASGSINAAKSILGPALDPVIEGAKPQKPF